VENQRQRDSWLELPLGTIFLVNQPTRLGLGGNELLKLASERTLLVISKMPQLVLQHGFKLPRPGLDDHAVAYQPIRPYGQRHDLSVHFNKVHQRTSEIVDPILFVADLGP
jgi:hypothetical protein